MNKKIYIIFATLISLNSKAMETPCIDSQNNSVKHMIEYKVNLFNALEKASERTRFSIEDLQILVNSSDESIIHTIDISLNSIVQFEPSVLAFKQYIFGLKYEILHAAVRTSQ